MTFEEWLGKDNTIGQSIMERKYRRFGESFDEWLDRVSGGDPELRQMIFEKKILLGGRTMANRGIDGHASYFNCYSSGFVEDDFADIMDVAKNIGLTFKAQGGQGVSLSKLRPKGTPVGKDYASDGIIPFMKLYNEVTSATSQGGARKGALLISLDAWHKEAPEFIKIKSQEGLVEKANLSLEIDDEFMRCVETGERQLRYEDYSGHDIYYNVDPKELFHSLAENAWDWADPGVIFTERFRNFNLMQYDDDYQIETCNPCGEQPLPKHGACCLASLNLSEFVENPYTNKAYFKSSEFVQAVKIGIRTLDILIDENADKHPLPQQREMSLNYRNIGLGVFGYATMLFKLGMKYGSIEAIRFTDDLFGLMFKAAVIESNERAKELGPFPKYKDVVFDSDIMAQHFTQDEIDNMRQCGLRNCSLVSIAPTGSIATMLGESGGCEPEFAIKYTRRTVGMTEGEDTYYDIYCKGAREYIEINHTTELPDYFVASHDIPWGDRIVTQAIMQMHVDTAISSTVNLPNSATVEDIEQLYLEAWKQGLKGVTIFRDGCKRMPILSTEKKDIRTVGKKRKLTTGCGSLHFNAYFYSDTGKLAEIYLNKGSTGGCNNFMICVSRLVSELAQNDVDIYEIVDQLNSCGVCSSYAVRTATKHDTSPGSCCPVAIGKALIEMYKEMQDELKNFSGVYKRSDEKKVECKKVSGAENTAEEYDGQTCPVCHSSIEHIGGCDQCTNCGWSKCE